MSYTHIRIKQDYRDRLAKLASSHNRSMANMVEVLIEQAEQNMPSVTTVNPPLPGERNEGE